MERMKKQGKRGAGGFTLVELIVVIAVLAILAGVGTVAYSGYIKRAHKAVDQQLVADVIYAIQLADYANPGLLNGKAGMVVLTDAAEPQVTLGTDEENAAFQASLEDAIADLSSARLQYNWGVDTTTAGRIIDSLGASGTGLGEVLATGATVSYAGNAAYMWDEVARAGNAVEEINGTRPEQALKNAAAGTVNDNPAEHAGAWENGVFLADTNAGIGAVAAATARNYAFAEYLKTNCPEISADTIDIFQNWENSVGISFSESQSQVGDFIGYIYVAQEDYHEAGYDSPLALLVDEFQNDDNLADFDEMTLETLYNAAIAYTTAPEGGNSQAYVDGLAYYTLMYNINDISSGGDALWDPQTDSLDDLSGFVDLAGQICGGQMDTAALSAALNQTGNATNAIIILAYKSGDALVISTAPGEIIAP